MQGSSGLRQLMGYVKEKTGLKFCFLLRFWSLSLGNSWGTFQNGDSVSRAASGTDMLHYAMLEFKA